MHRPAALDAAREPIAVAKHLGDKIRPLAGFDHGAFAKVPLSCDSGKVFDVVPRKNHVRRDSSDVGDVHRRVAAKGLSGH